MDINLILTRHALQLLANVFSFFVISGSLLSPDCIFLAGFSNAGWCFLWESPFTWTSEMYANYNSLKKNPVAMFLWFLNVNRVAGFWPLSPYGSLSQPGVKHFLNFFWFRCSVGLAYWWYIDIVQSVFDQLDKHNRCWAKPGYEIMWNCWWELFEGILTGANVSFENSDDFLGLCWQGWDSSTQWENRSVMIRIYFCLLAVQGYGPIEFSAIVSQSLWGCRGLYSVVLAFGYSLVQAQTMQAET